MKNLALVLALLSTTAFAGDIIINEKGQHEGHPLQKAVFVSVFLPDDMTCSQPVSFKRPTKSPEAVECEEGVLVISPEVCPK